MDTMNYSDPDSFKDPVQPRVTEDSSRDVSVLISELIRAGQNEKAWAVLEAEILKGIDSGPPEPWTKEDWASLRARILRGGESSS